MNILKIERAIALLKPIVWKMPVNKKREAYITLLTAAQKATTTRSKFGSRRAFYTKLSFPTTNT